MTKTEILINLIKYKGRCDNGVYCPDCPLDGGQKCITDENVYSIAKKMLYDIDPSLLFDLEV